MSISGSRVRGATLALLLLVLSSSGVAAASGREPPRFSPLSAREPAVTPSVLPIPGPARVLRPFRAPASRYGPGHRGVDLAAPVAAVVRAAASGVVVFAGQVAGRGVVSIDHPVGIRTTYEPVTASVKAGQHVVAGQSIGALTAGHPTCAPAVCLHWGARLPDGSYLDPMGLLGTLDVRLLPWAG